MTEKIKEMLTTMSGFGSITKGDILDLITTIESQKEEIEQQDLKIEEQELHITLLNGDVQMWQNNHREVLAIRDAKLESLKAITELAVKGLKIAKAMSSKEDIPPALYNSASWYLAEIERLQNDPIS